MSIHCHSALISGRTSSLEDLHGGTSTTGVEQTHNLLLLFVRNVTALKVVLNFSDFFLLLYVSERHLRQLGFWLTFDEFGAFLIHHFGREARGDGILDVLRRNSLVNLVKGQVGHSLGQMSAKERQELL